MTSPLTHFDAAGQAHMVDVGDKASTHRVALACGTIRMKPETLALVLSGTAKKGDVLGIARIAAIQGAKRTSDLIPLCHPLAITRIAVDFAPDEASASITCTARVECRGQTGVEMEALTAVQVGLLTIYDMCKAADRGMVIDGVRLLEKHGGKTGSWAAPAGATDRAAPGAPSVPGGGPPPSDPLAFTCNVCGAPNVLAVAQLTREAGACRTCGSTVRMRSMVHLLTLSLFGRSRTLPELAPDRSIRGIGLSDWDGYARPLERLFDYRNTYYHVEPRVDVTRPPADMLGTLDFLVSTDVFEHVGPPVARAFAGAAAMLKPGGWMIFSVPYTLEATTAEHFPSLHDYRIEQRGDAWVLVNRREDGRTEEFTDLVFHGGPGQTVEMRVFCRDDVLRHAREAGFDVVEVLDDQVWEYGIHDPVPWSRSMRFRKGGG